MSFKARLRPVKRVLAKPIEILWRTMLTWGASSRRSKVRPWTSAGGARVMVVAPHPDDDAIACGGTVLRHAQAADRVTIAICTDGRRSRALADPALMAAHRKAEAMQAARLMRGVDMRWMGLPEGEWAIPQMREALGALLEELRPDLVYAPSRVDFHPEHLNVAHALSLALEQSAHRPATLRVYQVQVPLTSTLTNVICQIDTVLHESEAALRAYASQSGSCEFTHRRRRYSASLHGLRGAVEEFWELPVDNYVELHSDPPAQWHDGYRGLRPFPLTDPLAWLVGTAARRKLRAQVCGRGA
jgi:LmbE family N-acetylglucosaminyl deacetylase